MKPAAQRLSESPFPVARGGQIGPIGRGGREEDGGESKLLRNTGATRLIDVIRP
jgi:hypothetical protein